MSIAAAIPENEAERLAALHRCHILDTLPEEDYDDLVFLAAQICGTPVALISLADAERQWFKAHFGPGNINKRHARMHFAPTQY